MDDATRTAALLSRIGLDSNAATELLAIAGECFENGKPLPDALAKFLAASIRRAMSEPSESRAAALVFELGFTAPAKDGRPLSKVDYQAMCRIIEHEFKTNGGISETKLKGIVAKADGVSANTALKHVKPAMLMPKILASNSIKSLMPPRPRRAD